MPTVADRDILHLYPDFRVKVQKILDELTLWCSVHYPNHKAALAEGYRSAGRQAFLYKQGRTTPGPVVTQKNGTTSPSNHQSCLAADIAFDGLHGLVWPSDTHEAWKYLGHLARAQGLTWGGDWTGGFVDRPHIEHSTKDKATYTLARVWKKTQGLK